MHDFNSEDLFLGEKPYECTDCGVCFRLYGNLKGHQRIHSGKKNDRLSTSLTTCLPAGYTLTRTFLNLDENPFFCDICKKSFRLKRELRLHMGIHSG